MSVVIRPWDSDKEAGIVFRSWMNTYGKERRGPLSVVSNIRLYAGHRPFVDKLVGRSTVLVAQLKGVDLVLGFVVFERGVLHYVWTRKKYRRQGIARALLKRAQEIADGEFRYVSHLTRSWREMEKRRPYSGWAYSPGHAFYPPKEGIDAYDEDLLARESQAARAGRRLHRPGPVEGNQGGRGRGDTDAPSSEAP